MVLRQENDSVTVKILEIMRLDVIVNCVIN